jgi:uncharacterized Rmd1/YagE family protein
MRRVRTLSGLFSRVFSSAGIEQVVPESGFKHSSVSLLPRVEIQPRKMNIHAIFYHKDMPIDIKSLISKHFPSADVKMESSRIGLNAVVTLQRDPEDFTKSQFVLLYNLGAVVMVNVPSIHRDKNLGTLFRSLEESKQRKTFFEDYAVQIAENEEDLEGNEYGKAFTNHIVVEAVDENSLKIISNVLVQSAALHFLRSELDKFFTQYQAFLRSDVKSGSLRNRVMAWIGEDKRVVKFIQEMSLIQLTLYQLQKLQEYSDISWNDPKYEEIQQVMEEELDVANRMDSLHDKVSWLFEMSKAFFEIHASRYSHKLELVIILFIFLDMCHFGSVIIEWINHSQMFALQH